MKKLLPLFASALVLLVGCGGPSFSDEEQAAVDAAKSFYLDIGDANWKSACAKATPQYTKGTENISRIISSIGPKGIQRRAKPKPCPASLRHMVEAQSVVPPGKGYEDPAAKSAEISSDGKSAKVTLEVSNESFLGNRTGQGTTETVFEMSKIGGTWKFNGSSPAETDETAPDQLPVMVK